MGCNAWNHPPGCDCGWGGQGNVDNLIHNWIIQNTYTYQPRTYKPALHPKKYLETHWALYTSYVQPNARCPVCGERVYFYQSPYGGRVFFDELGPPWPKHPCTDNQSSYLTHNSHSTTNKKQNSNPTTKSIQTKSQSSSVENNLPIYNWQSSGWIPFSVEKTKTEGSNLLIEGHILTEKEKINKLITCPMASRRYYIENNLGFFVGYDFLSNIMPMTEGLVNGLVMIKFHSCKIRLSDIDLIYIDYNKDFKHMKIHYD
jgi:hypothetical protein